MRWFYKLPLRLRSLFRKRHVEQELGDELRFHLEKLVVERVAKGISPQNARYAALRELGGVEQIKEECRDMRRLNLIENLIQDIRYGLRMLRRDPGFTAVAASTLALGIGATTMIFGALNATLWRAFPFRDPARLVMVWSTSREIGAWGRASVLDYFDWKSRSSLLTSLAAYGDAQPGDVIARNQHLRIRAVAASANLLWTVGVRPTLGGPPAATNDDATGRDDLISFHLRQERFGGSVGVTGS